MPSPPHLLRRPRDLRHPRRRHHDACRRRHRERREPLAARRRRRGRRDPSRGRTGAARRMPHARRLRDRLGEDHARLPAAGEARHPRGRPGVAGRRSRTRTRCSPPATAPRSISQPATSSPRSPSRRSRPASIRFPRTARRASRSAPSRPNCPQTPRTITRVMFCCFSENRRSITEAAAVIASEAKQSSPCACIASSLTLLA